MSAVGDADPDRLPPGVGFRTGRFADVLADVDVSHRLEARRGGATELLRGIFSRHPEAHHFLLDYLVGLDHAVLARARTRDHRDLGVVQTRFTGFGDELTELSALDRVQGGHLAGDLRESDTVRDLIDDWIDSCWRASGGPDLAVLSYLIYEGDSDWFEMRSEVWSTAGELDENEGPTFGDSVDHR